MIFAMWFQEDSLELKMRPSLLKSVLVFRLCLSTLLCATWGVLNADQSQNPSSQATKAPQDSQDKVLPTAIVDTHEWNICVSVPHLKDSYWISVNYGIIERAAHRGIGILFKDAGGYPNLAHQIAQLNSCYEESVDAIIVASVSVTGLDPTLEKISRNVPVISVVNKINRRNVSARVGVAPSAIGALLGRYLAESHSPVEGSIKTVWLPGTQGSGWASQLYDGFQKAVLGTAIQVVRTSWGDSDRAIQRLLVQEALEEYPDIRYIIANPLAAEAAVSVVRRRGLIGKVKIISTQTTHSIYQAIKRGTILAAGADMPVLQGKLALDLAVCHLESDVCAQDISPLIEIISNKNLNSVDTRGLLPAPGYRVQYQLNAGQPSLAP